MATITQRATATASTGTSWTNVANAYDNSETTYASRSASGNSACHINGFSFDIPATATIDKVVVDFKVYTSNSYGYFSGFLYTDTGSSIAYNVFLNKQSQTTAKYFSLEVTADTIQSKLDSLNVYNKDIFTFLKSGVRVRWVGGGANNTSSSVTCRVYDVKVTVYYTPAICVSFDSVFSYLNWKNSGISAANGGSISNISDIGFTFQASVNDNYTAESPYFPVEAGKTYTFEYDKSGANSNEAFVFYHTGLGIAWSSFVNSTSTKFNFTVPSGISYITVRVDVNNSGDSIAFSNFRVYPAECEYMSDSVSAVNRSCLKTWAFPTPVRDGYNFLGWNTKTDGSGQTYTQSSTFPAADLVLYSQWEIIPPPKFTSVDMTYGEKQITETNKVPAGEGYILSVGAE